MWTRDFDEPSVLGGLFEVLDFEEIKTGNFPSDQNILKCKKLWSTAGKEPLQFIYENIIQKLGYSGFARPSDETEDKFVAESRRAILLVVRSDISSLFKRCILCPQIQRTEEENVIKLRSRQVQKKDFLTELLYLFGHSKSTGATEHGVKLLKVFLTLAQGNLESFRNHKDYKRVIDDIITDLAHSKIFDEISKIPFSDESGKKGDDRNKCMNLSQLFLGILGWDMELILKSFDRENTLKEGYYFYSLYGCLNISKLSSSEKKHKAKIRNYLETFLSGVLGELVSKPDRKALMEMNDVNKIEDIMKEDLKANSEKSLSLKPKITHLFHIIHKSVKSKKNLNTSHCATAEALFHPDQEDITTFTDIIMSIVDGSFPVNLVETHVTNLRIQRLIMDLGKFMVRCIIPIKKVPDSSSSNLVDESSHLTLNDSFKRLIKIIKDIERDEKGEPLTKFWKQRVFKNEITTRILQLALVFHQSGDGSAPSLNSNMLHLVLKTLQPTSISNDDKTDPLENEGPKPLDSSSSDNQEDSEEDESQKSVNKSVSSLQRKPKSNDNQSKSKSNDDQEDSEEGESQKSANKSVSSLQPKPKSNNDEAALEPKSKTNDDQEDSEEDGSQKSATKSISSLQPKPKSNNDEAALEPKSKSNDDDQEDSEEDESQKPVNKSVSSSQRKSKSNDNQAELQPKSKRNDDQEDSEEDESQKSATKSISSLQPKPKSNNDEAALEPKSKSNDDDQEDSEEDESQKSVNKLVSLWQRKPKNNDDQAGLQPKPTSNDDQADSPDQKFLKNTISLLINSKVKFNEDYITFMNEKNSNVIKHKDRLEIFFAEILMKLFKGLGRDLTEEELIQMYHIFIKLKIDWGENLVNLPKAREVAMDVFTMMINLKMCDDALPGSIMSIIHGDLNGYKKIITTLAPEIAQANADSMIDFLIEVKEVINDLYAQKNKPIAPIQHSNDSNIDLKSDAWILMVDKINNGTASSKDLFKMVDEEGDKSGSISEKEFYTLTRRLGLNLSEHRIKEIFAKIKVKGKNADNKELNEVEFQKAMGYLQEKNLSQALQLLGITPEILTGILIRLTILLIFILVFIFIGIKAFAIGGTFGSIVNSLFPAGEV